MFTVLWRFFVLGLYSFGGPAAHIGYFQREFVQDKKWLTDQDFTHAVALCQFLPGPASSQLGGMYIGYKKASYLGASAAFIGFTFPSFLLLTLLAIGNQQYSDVAFIDTIIQAAKLLAVVVVADALWGNGQEELNDQIDVCCCLPDCCQCLFQHRFSRTDFPYNLCCICRFIAFFERRICPEASLRECFDKAKCSYIEPFCCVAIGHANACWSIRAPRFV